MTSPDISLASLSGIAQGDDRFGVYVRPLPDGESQVSILANVEGVTFAEVSHHLVKALSALTRTPLATIPTVAQAAESARLAAVAAEHPATRTFVLDVDEDNEKRVFLSAAGIEAVRADLLAAGWRDAGKVSQTPPLACSYMRDPEGFREAFLPSPPPNGAGNVVPLREAHPE